MSDETIVRFTCGGCGRDGFEVVDRHPPIPGEYIEIYDKDNEGESCVSCKVCDTYFPEFTRRKP